MPISPYATDQNNLRLGFYVRNDLIQQQSKIPGFVLDRFPVTGQLALNRPQLVSQMQTGKNRSPRRIEVACFPSDVRHQFVDLTSQFFDLLWIAGRRDRVDLVEDGNPDNLFCIVLRLHT